jgi:hypothetical protein
MLAGPRPVSFGLIQVLLAGEPSRMTHTGYHRRRPNQMTDATIAKAIACGNLTSPEQRELP